MSENEISSASNMKMIRGGEVGMQGARAVKRAHSLRSRYMTLKWRRFDVTWSAGFAHFSTVKELINIYVLCFLFFFSFHRFVEESGFSWKTGNFFFAISSTYILKNLLVLTPKGLKMTASFLMLNFHLHIKNLKNLIAIWVAKRKKSNNELVTLEECVLVLVESAFNIQIPNMAKLQKRQCRGVCFVCIALYCLFVSFLVLNDALSCFYGFFFSCTVIIWISTPLNKRPLWKDENYISARC